MKKLEIPKEFAEHMESIRRNAPADLSYEEQKAFSAIAFIISGREHESILHIMLPLFFDVFFQMVENVEMDQDAALETAIAELTTNVRENWARRQILKGATVQ